MTSEQWLIWALCVVGAYVLGGVPFGLLIGLAKGVDVRQHGSKNIGASNVGRTLGRKWGVLTFLLDGLKGFAPVFIAGFALGTVNRPDAPVLLAWAWLSFGIAAILGHLYSPFLKFKGGKGVATGFGALLAVFPLLSLPALAAIVVWAISVKTTRYMGFSSCIAAVTLPLFTFAVIPFGNAIGLFAQRDPAAGPGPTWPLWPYMTAGLIMAMLVVMRHRSNLKRMLEGTEPKVKSRSERQAEKAARAAQADGGTAGHAGVNGGGVGEAGVSAERPDGAMAGR
ncbi:MAG: glycerol-3-phosphate 1-O-acyltransferase PlsY [bacterium]|jgi:glycerol-3-phosphate acyltransferase PlsY|nr:glycerol-3-phosphate 1-O-acyltransferase PlsY [Phycisphaerales bacterium]